MADQFKHLFTPLKVGSMTVPNRLVSTAHHPGLQDPGWLPGDRLIAYWEAKAKGEFGLICTGVQGIPHRSIPMSPFQHPQGVERFKRAADAVQRHGSCFVIQIWHPGGSGASLLTGNQAWSSSAIPSRVGLPVPHAMTNDEVKEVIEAYASAATMSKQAGVNGVEIHGAHGYLHTQFMSPFTNKRSDEYGGDMESRMRFTLEVIDAVRDAVGRDFMVGIRVNGDEFMADGYTLDDMKIMAPMMTRSGNLDYISVSSGGSAIGLGPTYSPVGHSVYLASGIREVVDVAVITGSSRNNDPVQAEKILEDGHADMVGMTRAAVCDPELPKKAHEGRLEEIRKCLGCSEGCSQRVLQERNPLGIACSYNPVAGKESLPGWLDLIPAQTKKKVMVIGGGPAGMEAARVAAARGHRVSIWEKGDDLGGMVLVAAKAPGREDMGEVPRYYRYQMKLLGVDVNLNSEVTLDTVKKENPDVVVVAIGSLPRVPYDIKGIDQDNVVNNVRDVLTGKAEVGQNVLIDDYQHHIQGLSTADFLSQQGKNVQVITNDSSVGTEMDSSTRHALLHRLGLAGVKITADTKIKEISGNTVTVANVYTGQERVIEGIDTVILSYGGVENNDLYYALKGQVKEVHIAGDCKAVRKLVWATNDGATVARMI